MQVGRLIDRCLHQGGVLLRDLVELRYCGGNFGQTGTLSRAGCGNLRHLGSNIANAFHDLGDVGASGLNLCDPGRNLGRLSFDQVANFPG